MHPVPDASPPSLHTEPESPRIRDYNHFNWPAVPNDAPTSPAPPTLSDWDLIRVGTITNPVSTLGDVPDRQLGSSGLNPCLDPPSSILTNLDSWLPIQLSLSLPPIPLGLSPLGQDTKGYASINIPPPPASATQQQLCSLQHPVPPPKRRRLNPLGDEEGTAPRVLGSTNVQMCIPSPPPTATPQQLHNLFHPVPPPKRRRADSPESSTNTYSPALEPQRSPPTAPVPGMLDRTGIG